MTRATRLGANLAVTAILLWGTKRLQAAAPPPPSGDEQGRSGAVTGYIRDADCLFRNPEAGAPEPGPTLECAVSCVRGGAPLVVFSTDRKIYLVLSDETPGVAMNTKLLPYVGKLATVSGKLFERDGLRAIAVESVNVAGSQEKMGEGEQR